MMNFAKRNIMIFFKDRSAVFFSLLSVFIIIGLYVLFLGDVWVSSLPGIDNAKYLMNSWIVAGLLAVTSITAAMGAFGIMVEDKTKKIAKDFYASPLKRSSIIGGYLLSSLFIGVIMSIVALVLGEIYIIASGGELLPAVVVLKLIGVLMITCLANTALVCFMVSFFNSQNAFTTASTIIGTLIGFITGIYLPIGNLPEAVQLVIKIFPLSHGAALLRQIMMDEPISAAFANVPSGYIEGFKEAMGVVYRFGDYTVTPWVSLEVLILTAVIFYMLAMLNIRRKGT
ncbi:MAG: ABC transporter permease [Syntrophomonadaceae bacterium]|nr:ABC transporter permease [Syntrophomonadaceae bacterium]